MITKLQTDLSKLAKRGSLLVPRESSWRRASQLVKIYAHPVLALDYAEYLNPAIGVEVREVFIRYREMDVSLALEIMGELTAQADYDAERLKLRQQCLRSTAAS